MSKNPFTPATAVAKKLKVLIYGPSGSGKTVAALTFPRVALVDAEGGSDMYAGRSSFAPFDILRVKSLPELESAIDFIQGDGGKTYDTLVIDPITVFYDIKKDATARGARNNQMGFQEWAKVNNAMRSLYNRLTNLPVHVVGIARESIEYEGEGTNLKKTGTKPDADKALVYIFDFVVHMNADHSGELVKSRGVVLGDKGRLAQVNWSAFTAAAQTFTEGKTITQVADEDAALKSLDDLRDPEIAREFITRWRNEGLTDAEVLSALSVSRLSEWADGRKKADAQVTAWIEAQMLKGEPTSANGAGK